VRWGGRAAEGLHRIVVPCPRKPKEETEGYEVVGKEVEAANPPWNSNFDGERIPRCERETLGPSEETAGGKS